ncbi:MAG: alpha/beta fold hydrolase [Flammeovirgaceae bacterium]
MDLHYKKIGDTGQPLIILHGVFGSSDNWMTLGRKFAESHQVYLVDNRDHGRSPHTNEFTYDAMKEDLRRFIENQEIENPIITGHSMGGKVSMLFALQYPELYDKLVVVDIAARSYPIHHGDILDGLNAIDTSAISSRKEADALLAASEPNFAVRQFLLKNLYRDKEKGFQWRFNLDAITNGIENISIEIAGDQPNYKPTLFMRGLKSHYVADEDKPHLAQLFPQAQFLDFEDAGHWIHAEKPLAFYNAVMDFVNP